MKRIATLLILGSATGMFGFLSLSGQAAGNGAPAGGAAIYNQHCVKCHGAGGRGVENFTPDLAKVTSRGHWPTIIKEGKGTMPGFKDSLKPMEVNAVLSHIRSFGQSGKKK
ncbi:MAG: cytochrome c [Blastocatellia bacterium]